MAIFAEIDGEDQWTEVLDGSSITRNKHAQGLVQVSIHGDFVANVSIQRQFDDEPSRPWRTTDVITEPYEGYFAASDVANYRIGVATGNYTSGTISVRMGA